MITPAQPTRITGYASGSPLWRVTLQREDREGRTVSYLPEIVTTQGAAPDYATAHLFRGFRPRLEIQHSGPLVCQMYASIAYFRKWFSIS